MRKWTYLVAALLIGGVSTSLTSCIDNEEPAGITDLRGAKAELLRAKAQVEQAEAAYRTAKVAIEEAKAAYLQEKVAQEKLATELQSAKDEAQKAKIQQKMQLQAEEFKAQLLAAQTEALKADAAYQQALIDIELVLSTYKEDRYAQELKNFLSGSSENGQFTYNVPYLTNISYDANGLTYDIEEKAVTVYGYNSLIAEMSRAQNELVQLLDGKAKYDFNPQVDVLTEENNAWIAQLQGEIKAEQELAEKYKTIQGKSVSEWETEYDQIDKDIEAENAKIDAIELQKKNDLIPLNEEMAKLNSSQKATAPVKFEINQITSDEFTSKLSQILWQISLTRERRDIISQEIISQQSQGEDGIIYPNGLTLNLTNNELDNLLNYQPYNEYYQELEPSLLEYVQQNAALKDNNGEALDQQTLKKYETNMKDAQSALEAKVKEWTPAKDNFIKAAETYRYNYKSTDATNKYDGRTNLIKALDAYLAIAKPSTEQKNAIVKSITDYLTGRKTLDGFDPQYTPAEGEPLAYTKALADAKQVDAALTAFFTVYQSGTPETVIGYESLDATNKDGLYGKLYTLVKEIWGQDLYVTPRYETFEDVSYYVGHYLSSSYGVNVENKLVLMSQEEWEALPYRNMLQVLYNNASIIDNQYYTFYMNDKNAYYTTSLGDGLLNDYLAATYIYNSKKELIEQNATWKTFSASVEKINETLQKTLTEYSAKVAELNLKINAVTTKAQQDEAAIQLTIKGLNSLKNIMDLTLTQVLDEEGGIQMLKNKIAEIEGGIVIDGDKQYYVIGSIAEKEAQITYYENFNQAIADGTYEKPLDTTLQWYEDQIKIKQTEIELLNALYTQATEKKDMLLEVITGGSSTTPAE